MNTEDKISCICITHNRVDMLKRAIACFESQTYNNKELVVLFENDVKTSEFVNENKNYKSGNIKEQKNSECVIIEFICKEHKQFSEILNNEEVYLKINENDFLSATIDGKLELQNNCNSIQPFLLERNEEKISIRTSYGTWLNINQTDTSQYITYSNKPEHFTSVLLINNKIKLIPSWKFQNESELSVAGWELEILNNTNSSITFYEVLPAGQISLGSKRNLAIKAATGDYICVWDDDDWYGNDRLYNQMNFLKFTKKSACSLANQFLFDNSTGNAYISSPRNTGWENSLLCKKSDMGHYENLPKKEDTPLLNRLLKQKKLTIMDEPQLYIYNLHSNNVSNGTHFRNIIKYSERLPEEETTLIKSRLGFNGNHNNRESDLSKINTNYEKGNVIIRLTDGMGNQMFQYACGYALAKNKNKQVYYDARYLGKKDGFANKRYFELDVFNLTGIELMHHQLAFSESKFNGFIKENSCAYSPDMFKVDSTNLYLNGYFQSEKYFKQFEGDIKKEFSFCNILTGKNIEIKEKIENSNSISIHIRRGDYTESNFWGVCALSYYNQAIEYLTQKISNPFFFVFSDEPEWAVENLKTSHNIIFISHNRGKDSFLDLQLMSLCKHNIIANSTFSWWAAWLNANPDKIVISPKQWYEDTKMNNLVIDLIPDGWLRF